MAENPHAFPEIDPLPAPQAPEPQGIPWQWPASALLLIVIALTALGARLLAAKHPAKRASLDQADDQLALLAKQHRPAPETARQCARILSDAWAQRYQEPLLNLPASTILQRRAFLRQLPQELNPAYLLFLAECVEISYRPASEARPSEQIIQDTQKLLNHSRHIDSQGRRITKTPTPTKPATPTTNPTTS